MARDGRPTVMTPETIAKLEEAFLIGASDKEACFVANIAPSTLYAYCQENPDFSERKEALKDMPKYKARKNIVDSIDKGNVPVSQWYAERKVKEEFSPRVEQTGKDGGAIQIESTDEIKKLTEQLNAIHRGNGISSDGGTSSTLGDQIQDKE